MAVSNPFFSQTIKDITMKSGKQMQRLHLKFSSHDPISIQLTLKIFVCVMEFVGVHPIQFFASNYFVTSLRNFNNSCFENFMLILSQLDPAVAAIL